jgi:sortase A
MTVHILFGRSLRLGQSSIWRFAQRFFLIAGLFAVGYVVYTEAARHIYQEYENWAFDRLLLRHPDATPSAPHGSMEQVRDSRASSLIGRIAIPRLGISAIINEGVDAGTLSLAVGHIPSTALPGQLGNVGVAAHRDALFRNLKDVQRNDEITLTTLDGEYVYRVISFKVVNPADVSVLSPSANERTLTLVTCYPFYFVGQAPKRFIVRARQVSIVKNLIDKAPELT